MIMITNFEFKIVLNIVI